MHSVQVCTSWLSFLHYIYVYIYMCVYVYVCDKCTSLTHLCTFFVASRSTR